MSENPTCVPCGPGGSHTEQTANFKQKLGSCTYSYPSEKGVNQF